MNDRSVKTRENPTWTRRSSHPLQRQMVVVKKPRHTSIS
ncbi:MAG: hypothetical protein ACI8RC_000530, partial [Ilumatobacter sp.]